MPNDKARNAPAFRFRIQFVESKTAPACISTEQTKVFMIQDFKFALRQLLKAPGFTATAVLTLALAIGVNSAIFALINSVVLHPVVPLRPTEVVNVFTARQNASHDYRQFSYNEYREIRENGEVFADLAALEFAVAGIGRAEPGIVQGIGRCHSMNAAQGCAFTRANSQLRGGEVHRVPNGCGSCLRFG